MSEPIMHESATPEQVAELCAAMRETMAERGVRAMASIRMARTGLTDAQLEVLVAFKEGRVRFTEPLRSGPSYWLMKCGHWSEYLPDKRVTHEMDILIKNGYVLHVRASWRHGDWRTSITNAGKAVLAAEGIG